MSRVEKNAEGPYETFSSGHTSTEFHFQEGGIVW